MMDGTESRLDWVSGTSAATAGAGVLLFALFPLAIPILLLTILATLPLALPLIAVAVIATVLVVAGRAVRAAIHGFRGLESTAPTPGVARTGCPSC
jgi:hypothetical protein